MKLISKVFIILSISIIFFVSYLTFVGFETKKLNSQIIKKLKDIDQNIEIDLKEVKIILVPLELKLNAKTIGTKLVYMGKVIELESIKTQIPLISLFKNKFLITNLNVSSKSLKLKDFISFVRAFKNTPELYVLNRIVKKGFLIADIKIEFDENGNIKNDYKINGFLKDVKIDIFKKYKINKLNFDFDHTENSLKLTNLNLFLNELRFSSKSLNFARNKDDVEINGEIENEELDLSTEDIELFLKPYFVNLDVNRVKFSSKNNFSFTMNNKFKLSNLYLDSEVNFQELLFSNKIKIKEFFPDIKNDLALLDHKLKISFKNKLLKIDGAGDILLQDNSDQITYSVSSKNQKYAFKTSLQINENPFKIDVLNYEKDKNTPMILNLEGDTKLNQIINLRLISLIEKNNKIIIDNVTVDKKLNILDFNNVEIDYLDNDDIINKFRIIKKKNDYFLSGISFNGDYLITGLLNDNENKVKFQKDNFNLNIKLSKFFLDKNNSLENFEGNLLLNNQEILDGHLTGFFSKNEKFSFSIKSNKDERITTLFLDRAKPLVNRYKFVKGFSGGKLDFYSSKNNTESISKIKIYDFKLKELPALTKLLTLASLQGIADLLSGEGITFDEFEINFKNNKNVMTIEEIYAIGPAISILMDGYVEKNKLISLRGTLVPATTINKAIGSIPVLGQILVGSKTGEGVFGVSFKIKGHPNDLATTVNPIKTLTPRFITRTLEKIKKTN